MATSSDQLLHCPAPRPMTVVDRWWRASNEPAPNCPRCASPNTKFCYYNNYSLSQPRYFCKGCRRYWTKGGSLRNVPVGGGCRKSRRSRSSKSSSGGSSTGLGTRSSSELSPNSCSDTSGGPNIDLAAVFAKFLNNDQSSNNVSEENTEPTTDTPSEASHDSLTSSSYGLENGFETQNLADDILDQEFQMTEGVGPSDSKQLQEEEAIQGFISSDLASFDHIIEDVFWSDESDLSSLTWQPVVQLQDFDSPPLPVDQIEGSTNPLSCDNWSYFDTTGFEVFSKP